jgi:hypothetical protein
MRARRMSAGSEADSDGSQQAKGRGLLEHARYLRGFDPSLKWRAWEKAGDLKFI